MLSMLLIASLLLAPQSPAPGRCDVDGDGTAEIEQILTLETAGDAAAPGVVVLVEHRLLTARAGVAPDRAAALRQRLHRLVADLAAEGRRAELLDVTCYGGARHQDGRVVLALRRLLAQRRAQGALEGAILVGHFPDALLLR
ncbi:MAG: hypothetical protein KDC98_24525, partial [Planctomycetes bacterium]|nr:hypothetical protein [Planctomycetota bacterium]